MEDQAECEALAGADGGDAVADGDADQPRVDRTGRSRVVKTKPWPSGSSVDVPRDWARGPLFDEQELTAGVVDARLAEVDDDLQRKHQLAVQIPMERVPVTLAVLEQDRGRLLLARRVTHVQPLVEVVGPRGPPAELGPPVPRDRQQPGVQRLLECFDRLGVRLLEYRYSPSPNRYLRISMVARNMWSSG